VVTMPKTLDDSNEEIDDIVCDADKDDEAVLDKALALIHFSNNMTVPAHRHLQNQWRMLLLNQLLLAMRDSLRDDALLDVNVCELVADYLEDPKLARKTFLPMMAEPEDGETFPTTISKFAGQWCTTTRRHCLRLFPAHHNQLMTLPRLFCCQAIRTCCPTRNGRCVGRAAAL
jgi:hypothetical protein